MPGNVRDVAGASQSLRRTTTLQSSSLVFIMAGERLDENCFLTLQFIGGRRID
jgi:hypothetical protein